MNTQPTPTPATHGLYWITDPGHAWLAVDTTQYPEALDYGTGYGYCRPGWIFLEEDLEAPAFLLDHPAEAHASHHGQLAIERHIHNDAPVRRLPRNTDELDVAAFDSAVSAAVLAAREQVTA